MRPILPGARGPAVEDIQQRLLKLGYEIGPTGIDGVFLGATRDAVIAFQTEQSLCEDGVVGPETWAALVDATFTLGDRTLYLRLPYFHGYDVRVLQEALNALGFSCGIPDGIFGSYCERAVREFQRNCGQPEDGIVGSETVRALLGLRHVWEGKGASSASATSVAPARSVETLRTVDVVIEGDTPHAVDVAERVVNLARASDEFACISLGGGVADVRIRLLENGRIAGSGPLVALGQDAHGLLAARIATALSAAPPASRSLDLDLEGRTVDVGDRQRAAVRVVDALCAALA